MRFDAPLPPENPPGRPEDMPGAFAELPDDLQLLAEQLSEDALHLSSLYPPRAPLQWHQQSLRSQQPLGQLASLPSEPSSDFSTKPWQYLPASSIGWLRSRRLLAVASLLIAATLAWRMWPAAPATAPLPVVNSALHSNGSLHQAAAEEAKKSAVEELHVFRTTPTPASPQPVDSSGVIGEPRRPSEAVSPGLFLTLSGLEQEAMLDLIEGAKLEQPSVSF